MRLGHLLYRTEVPSPRSSSPKPDPWIPSSREAGQWWKTAEREITYG